jgi:putative heme-binding domain-containing protein
VYPSEGIGFGYEGWLVQLNDGSVMSGIISSKTKSTIDLKFPGGSTSQVKVADVKLLSQSKESLMPDGLYSNFSNQDFSDLLEYLSNLKKGK